MRLAYYRVRGDRRDHRSEPTEDLEAPWVRFGDQVLILADDAQWDAVNTRAAREGLALEPVPRAVQRENLRLVVQKGRLFQQEHPEVPVLLDKGRYLVVELAPEAASRLAPSHVPCYEVCPLEANTVVFDVRERVAVREAPETWVQELVDGVDRSAFEATLAHLVSFPTRHSLSDPYREASASARDQLAELGYDTRIEAINVGGLASENVVAERPGSGPGPLGLVLVVAHLDSINLSGGPSAPAPGADDNGSGSAGVIEIARVLKDHEGVQDFRLVLFGGEEQGLFGSIQHVESLSQADRARVRAVINMDMIGTLNTPSPTVLIEGAPISQGLIDALSAAAATYTSLEVQTSLSPFASDHVPFINAGMPAVLTIEGADGANDAIHSAHDTLDRIDHDLAVEILRMNVAFTALALGKALAPVPRR